MPTYREGKKQPLLLDFIKTLVEVPDLGERQKSRGLIKHYESPEELTSTREKYTVSISDNRENSETDRYGAVGGGIVEPCLGRWHTLPCHCSTNE